MTIYELGKETEAFRRGYWDAFHGTDAPPSLPSPSERVEYRRGYRIGLADYKSGR